MGRGLWKWRCIYPRCKKGARQYTFLQHVAAGKVALDPPLDLGHSIVDNDDDFNAKIVAKNGITEIPCYKIFQKNNKHGKIVPPLSDDRVGQALGGTPKGSGKLCSDGMLQIEDGRVGDAREKMQAVLFPLHKIRSRRESIVRLRAVTVQLLRLLVHHLRKRNCERASFT